jgi:ribosome-binding factor A
MSRKPRRTHSRFAKSDTSIFSHGDSPDEAAGHRHARLEHILLETLQSLVTDEASDPALAGIRLLAVHLSVDGSHARVAYAVVAALRREGEVGRKSQAALARASGFLRARLAQQLDLKRLPQLAFTFVGVAQTGGEPCPE